MLPKIFKPYDIKLKNLIRIGPKYDGGYVIDKRVIKKTHYIITCGLNDDWNFEKEFVKKNMHCKVLAYDHTVTNNFWKKRFFNDLINFFLLKKLRMNKIIDIFRYIEYKFFFRNSNKHYKKKIVKKIKNIDSEETIKNILKNKKQIVLKVDIEGDEYNILRDIIFSSKKINLLIIEFHNISKNINKIKSFIKKLKLRLIHIHGNNYENLNNNIDPNVVEMTFVNHKKFKTRNYKTNYAYPLANLDFPNLKRRNDIVLKFHE